MPLYSNFYTTSIVKISIKCRDFVPIFVIALSFTNDVLYQLSYSGTFW
jgi:hypothetical protein